MPQRYSQVSNVPLALAVFLASDYYDHDDTPNTISATTLLKPLRQIILAARVPKDMSLPPLADMMSNRIGAALHDGIERAWKTNYAIAMEAMGYPKRVIDRIRINPTKAEVKANPDMIPIYMEQRLKRTLGKWTVTGKYDFIGEGRVQDFKSTSVWAYMNQVNSDKYNWQGSIYRWLDPELITQDEMDVHNIFVDWRASAAKSDPNYPPQRFKRQTFALHSVAETENYIRQKIALIEKYWEAPEDEIPECNEEDLWRSKTVYKYYKSGNINAPKSTKNFEDKTDAYTHLATQGVGAIKEVPGQVKACRYCTAFPVCTQKDALVAAGDLVL